MRTLLKAVAFVSLLTLPTVANAQSYPSKQVTVYIPSTPGGGNDTMGRLIAHGLSKTLGGSVIPENKPGAGGAIAYAHVAKAKGDGHSILSASMTYAMTAALSKDLPFNPLKDLTAVALTGESDIVLVAGNRVPIKTLDDLIKKSKTQKLFVASTGPESASRLNSNFIEDAVGVKWQHVTYNGGAEAVADLLGGRIDLWVASVPSNMAAIQAGATPIAVLGNKRSSVLPDVPTLSELGYPNGVLTSWWGVYVPSSTPPEVIKKINVGVNAAMNTPEATAALAKDGVTPANMTSEQFQKRVSDEIELWKKLSKEFGVK